ncbi:hypothetical protein [Pseudoalteromonas sp. P1-11]|uniref:hypothetical protein n=1 Tax=Pseudoalteromonas sp. P1-11 TaxID=1715254 RepID=UPI0006DCF784|nr:hypothetical protein [Pseudoalteromonas sp. P1-11]KPW03213.1 hypothetical protein AN390_01288 [Pseudoalteromonas sp. P1-11]
MNNHQEFTSVTADGLSFIGVTNPTLYEGFDPKLTPSDLVEYAGLIPQILCNGDEGNTFKQNVDNNYVYGHRWGDSATVDDEGMYHYPEDEPLAPILMILNPRTQQRAFVYPYALVAVQDEGKWITTRLD